MSMPVSEHPSASTSASASASTSSSASASASDCFFSGLVICVSGLSKEARKQVREATERFGGTYTPNLHPMCTHLVVQSLGGCKLRHGFRNGLFVVTLGWFIDSIKNKVRLSEVPYTVRSVGQIDSPIDDRLVGSIGAHDTCIPIPLTQSGKRYKESGGQKGDYSGGIVKLNKSQLFGQSIYIDLDVSVELQRKVVDVAAREGAVLVPEWFVGCGATYIVCEGPSIHRYLGHCDNIVSPIWVLKISEERLMQRFIRLSADLSRQVGVMLDNLQHITAVQETWKAKCHEHILSTEESKAIQKQRVQAVNLAKSGVRSRRVRRLQSCQVPLYPINPSSLLDSICWSVSEPPSRAAVYEDTTVSKDDLDFHKSGFSVGVNHVESEAQFSNSLRLLTDSERNELVFKSHFLTILYPVDRFAELGPSSRTYFSDTGFTCLQLLEFIYAFYQENMSDSEIEVAIHTDSRHADELRSDYCSERIEQYGCIMHKRIAFLGSRKSFEMLKRISGNNNGNVYELQISE